MSKNIAESLMGLHAEASRLGLPLDLVTNYFATLAARQGESEAAPPDTAEAAEAAAPARRKLTTVREFVQKVYPDLRFELRVALCRFFGEPFTDLDKVVSDMVLDGRFYWDAKKTPEPVIDSMVVHGGRGAGLTTLCRLVAAYEIIRRLEELEQGVKGGPYHVHLRVSNYDHQDKAGAVQQVSEWVKSFDPRVNSYLVKSTSMNIKFNYPEAKHGIGLIVDSYDPGPQASRRFTNPKYSLFISDADVIESADFFKDKCRSFECRSFEVFTSKFKPHAKNPNALQVYADLYAQGHAMSIFGFPYVSSISPSGKSSHKTFDTRWEVSPIRL